MKNIKPLVFKASFFFSSDFPFSVQKMVHTPQMYNESSRHQREFWKIIYVIKGSGWKLINSKRYRLKEGGLFLIHPKDSTTFVIESKKLEIYNIIFMQEFIQKELAGLDDEFHFFSIMQENFRLESEDRQLLHILESDQRTGQLIRNLATEYQKKKVNYRSLIKLNLLELLILLGRKASRSAKRQQHVDVVAYVNHVINTYFADEFDLTMLAEKAGISKSYLCRLYKQKTGNTITENLRLRRLAEAEKLLQNKNLNVSEICYACGFNDLSYFYRAFTSHTGKNPGDYRKSLDSVDI